MAISGGIWVAITGLNTSALIRSILIVPLDLLVVTLQDMKSMLAIQVDTRSNNEEFFANLYFLDFQFVPRIEPYLRSHIYDRRKHIEIDCWQVVLVEMSRMPVP